MMPGKQELWWDWGSGKYTTTTTTTTTTRGKYDLINSQLTNLSQVTGVNGEDGSWLLKAVE